MKPRVRSPRPPQHQYRQPGRESRMRPQPRFEPPRYIGSGKLFAKAALKHLKEGAAVINTTSVTAYRGSSHLIDYAATKGAIVAFTRSLSEALASRKIRVNGVAPGPIWTPLIPSTFPSAKVREFGTDVPLGHAGEPMEVAPAYVFLASSDSSYMTGQVLHPNGGEIING